MTKNSCCMIAGFTAAPARHAVGAGVGGRVVGRADRVRRRRRHAVEHPGRRERRGAAAGAAADGRGAARDAGLAAGQGSDGERAQVAAPAARRHGRRRQRACRPGVIQGQCGQDALGGGRHGQHRTSAKAALRVQGDLRAGGAQTVLHTGPLLPHLPVFWRQLHHFLRSGGM